MAVNGVLRSTDAEVNCLHTLQLPPYLCRSYHTGKPAAFLWQWIGSALFFMFPAITYTLQAHTPVDCCHCCHVCLSLWHRLVGM